jgi:hypothetical protein
MEIKKVLAHTCRKNGTERNEFLSTKKCRCRQYITIEDAAQEVASGIAWYVVLFRKSIEIDAECPTCLNSDKLKRTCRQCQGTGLIKVEKPFEIEGPDIVRIRTTSSDGKKIRKAPTLEEGHILRGLGAIGHGQKAARDRWDEYELLTLKERIRLLVAGIVTSAQFDDAWRQWITDTEKNFPLPLKQEPEDDQKTMTGRRFDYGRNVW